MNREPLFSLLVANYNNGLYIEECINSIFKQTYQNWEIILIDDASTDNSREIYNKYVNDKRIKILFNNKNKGCGYTKRKCVDIASGAICGFLDPDDAITPDALEIMVQSHKKHPNASIIYSTHYVCDPFLNVSYIAAQAKQIPSNTSYLESGTGIITAFASFKKGNYNKTKGINPKLTKAVDQDLYLKLEETGSTIFVNKPLYHYRHHKGSISLNANTTGAMLWAKLCQIEAYKRRKRQALNTINISKDKLVSLKKETLHIILYLSIQASKVKNYKKMYQYLAMGVKYINYDRQFSLFRIALTPLKQIAGNIWKKKFLALY